MNRTKRREEGLRVDSSGLKGFTKEYSILILFPIGNISFYMYICCIYLTVDKIQCNANAKVSSAITNPGTKAKPWKATLLLHIILFKIK